MALKRQTGLGRGLGAILIDDVASPNESVGIVGSNTSSEPVSSASEAASVPTMMDVTKIDPNPEQPRTSFDGVTIAELAKSIESLGIIQPITLREGDYGRYTIISGERRFKAAIMAGLTKVPVYVRKVDDETLLEMALVENIQREDLNPMEVAFSLSRLMKECGMTQEELSEKIGKNRATIANYIRLIKLPASVQARLVTGVITMGHAKALLPLGDEESQNIVLEKIIKMALSVRQTEELVSNFMAEPRAKALDKKIITPTDRALQLKDNLTSILGSKVTVTRNAKGESKMSIVFRNEGEIEKLLTKLL